MYRLDGHAPAENGPQPNALLWLSPGRSGCGIGAVLQAFIVTEQFSDFWIGGLNRKLPKGDVILVNPFAHRRKAVQESSHPLAVAGLNRISQVLQLNCQMSTQLSQVLNRPARRRCSKLAISIVDIRASLHQQFCNPAVPVERRVVKGCCS